MPALLVFVLSVLRRSSTVAFDWIFIYGYIGGGNSNQNQHAVPSLNQRMKNQIALLPVAVGLFVLAASATARADYKSSVLADNPPGYWRLGTIDPSAGVPNLGWLGTNVNGTVTGDLALTTDTPLLGDSDQATDFSSGGLIAIPFSAALNQTNMFTYEVWYKATGPLPGFPGNCPLWWRDEPTAGNTRGWVHYNNSGGNYFQSSDAVRVNSCTRWD
jgi:hypothetical protein